MRHVLSWIAVALGVTTVCAVTGSTALAGPVPERIGGTESVLAKPAGTKVCTIADDDLSELSGLIATRTGYVVINDGSDMASHKRVFMLDGKCQVKKPVSYSGNGPADPEDLALSADGRTLWIADTGDNVLSPDHRSTVALWSMPVDGSAKPVIHRLSYPERKAHDAEALLMASDGKPIIVTKTVGKAKVFVPAGPLKKNNPPSDAVPLRQVGEVGLPKTKTENPLGGDGRVAVTGAARSPDGRKVVLRTYADAFEWDVPDGDIVKAITTGKPRVTPLADPFGEAISYTVDGAAFVTVSESLADGGEVSVPILRYTQSTKTADPVTVVSGAEKPDDPSWFDSLTLNERITYLISAVGLVGVILVVAGVVGILRARRRPASGGGDAADRPSGPGRGSRDDGGWAGAEPGDHAPASPGHYGAPDAGRNAAGYGAGGGRNGAVYGGGSPAPGSVSGPPASGVYSGGRGRSGGGSGGVYGGGRGRSGGGSDGVYGGGGRSGGRPGGRGPGGGGYGGERGYGEDEPSRGWPPRGRGGRHDSSYDQRGRYDGYNH